MWACGIYCQVELLNALTMLPPLFSTAAACYAVRGKGWWRSSSALALIAGWFLMIPFSTASHLHCAFQGHYSHILIRLDQTGISVACVLAAWAMSKSTRFTAITAMASFSMDLIMWLGPADLRVHVAWRCLTLAGIVLAYLSPMFWMRDSYDESITPIGLCFIAGFCMAIQAPLGPYSHPLFHLLLIPYSYYVSRSAMVFELLLESRAGADREWTIEEGSFDGDEIKILETGDCWNTGHTKADELLKDAELSDVGDARDIELGTASQSNFPVFLKSC